MDIPIYDPKTTAILCIDFYNDFLSEQGKLWPWCKEMAERNRLLDNLRAVVRAARDVGAGIYHVPHHRWEPGDYVDWKYPSPYQLGAAERQAFAKDTWGGTFHDDFHVQPDDIVATEHWASSGFPNTDLEHKLKRYGKEKIICVGLLANTCLEATARIGMELGFHITLVRDGTAARSHEALHATLNIDGPTFAHEILTTTELVLAIRSSLSADSSATSLDHGLGANPDRSNTQRA